MKSHLWLMLEYSWALYMNPLVILMMEILSTYCLETQWDLLMVKFLTIYLEM